MACGATAIREEVPSSRPERVTSVRADDLAGYVYVATRTRSVVGLAEARNVPMIAARDAVDRLADGLDSCLREEERRGTATANGATRVVAHVDPRGTVSETAVRISADPGAAKVAIVCLVAPMRLMAFPENTASDRGLAVEALWHGSSPPTAAH
jgi:hypothetical protein